MEHQWILSFITIVIRLNCTLNYVFFYKNNINTRELWLNPVKGLKVNVTFLILDPNPLSLIISLFCVQIQNVVEMNLSYKPKDHNIIVPVYTWICFQAMIYIMYLFYFQSSNYYIVTHKNIAVVFSQKK